MLDCNAAPDNLLEYLEGGLPPDLHRGLDAHLGDCPWCRRLLQSYRLTTELCGKTLGRPAPAGFIDRLLVTLREQTQASRGTDQELS